MKSLLLVGVVALTSLLGETACGQRVGDSKVIIRAKNPGDRAGYLGVLTQDMTRRLAKAMEVKTEDGALVDEVVDDSPAEEAGLKEEDIIIEIDGKQITDADDLRSTIRKATPGAKVSIVAMRKDEKKTFTATIDKAPRRYAYSYTPSPSPRIPRTPRIPRAPKDIHIFRSFADLGMTISSLNKQLGKYFDAPDGKGVLVQEVEEDTRAAKAGFMAGDVIIRIGKESIKDVEDVTDALEDYKEDEKAEVEVLRKGARKTLTFEVPDMDRRHEFHLGSGHNWFNRNDIEPPDVEWEWDGSESLKENMRDLELELRDLGREIQSRARRVGQELKSTLLNVMS